MGLFRDLGRRAERLKRQVTAAAAESTHECADCGAPLADEPERCPECGSDAVVAID